MHGIAYLICIYVMKFCAKGTKVMLENGGKFNQVEIKLSLWYNIRKTETVDG